MDKQSAVETLKTFEYERTLHYDVLVPTVALLGTLIDPATQKRDNAIIRVEKLPFPNDSAATLITSLNETKLVENNGIYTWFLGWITSTPDSPEVKINVVFPATEVHIRKYSTQKMYMVRETPEVYRNVVVPFINSIPEARTQWVRNILTGVTESDKILHRDEPASGHGYVLLPDMKWDLSTVQTLYLVAITLDNRIKSVRDLRREHLAMLHSIQEEARKVVKDRWKLEEGSLRMYVHYQPSYYHFHVHIVNINHVGFMGVAVGQAYLLDDVIALLELDGDIYEKMTLSYGLGEQHDLFCKVKTIDVKRTSV